MSETRDRRPPLFGFLTFVILAAAASTAFAAGDKDQAWGKGISYTTDWKKAIKTARESGKMLFIYNGWARRGI